MVSQLILFKEKECRTTLLEFNGVLYVTKQMAADFYEVDKRTIDNCLMENEEELRNNGYRIWKGKELKELKLHFAHEKDFATKTTQIGLFGQDFYGKNGSHRLSCGCRAY